MTGFRSLSALYTRVVRGLTYALLAVAALGVLTIMLVMCAEVVCRKMGHPIVGALDIVKIAGAVTIACAMPYTTAVKGHVAIEYFFLKLSRRGRVIVDTFARSVGITLFVLLAWQSYLYAEALKRTGELTSTIKVPVFWVLYVVAFACAVVVLVIFHNMLHPGKEMIKP